MMDLNRVGITHEGKLRPSRGLKSYFALLQNIQLILYMGQVPLTT